MNHNAIYALYPNVVTVDDTAGAMDKDGNKVEIDMNQVNAWVDPNAYKEARARSLRSTSRTTRHAIPRHNEWYRDMARPYQVS
jgi:hypothetical protein